MRGEDASHQRITLFIAGISGYQAKNAINPFDAGFY
jgi:hypothetical protein